MRAIDVMTTSVICVQPETTVQEAARLLVDHRISGMPVVDERGALVGIVSEGDLLRRIENETQTRHPWWLEMLASTRQLAGNFVKEHGRAVHDVMSTRITSVDEQTPVAVIAELMEKRRIKRVPVLREGTLVGIVSRANLIRALASARDATREGPTTGDRDMAKAIVTALKGTRWAVSIENVIVEDGIAHLWGVIDSEEEERALCIAAEEVEGVKEARAHLSFPTVMPLM